MSFLTLYRHLTSSNDCWKRACFLSVWTSRCEVTVALEVTLHLRRSTNWLFFTSHYITCRPRPTPPTFKVRLDPFHHCFHAHVDAGFPDYTAHVSKADYANQFPSPAGGTALQRSPGVPLAGVLSPLGEPRTQHRSVVEPAAVPALTLADVIRNQVHHQLLQPRCSRVTCVDETRRAMRSCRNRKTRDNVGIAEILRKSRYVGPAPGLIYTQAHRVGTRVSPCCCCCFAVHCASATIFAIKS